ncbi:MAG: hypothetical protein ACP5I8_06490, partial [Phycisphaerae bacterium]
TKPAKINAPINLLNLSTLPRELEHLEHLEHLEIRKAKVPRSLSVAAQQPLLINTESTAQF